MRIAIAAAIVCAGLGCGPRVLPADAGRDASGEDTGAADGDASADGTAAEEAGEASTGGSGGIADCHPVDPAATMGLVVEFAGRYGPDVESWSVERRAWCTIMGGAGGPGSSELLLSCDEVDGALGVEYRIAFETPIDPLASWIDWGAAIDLEYDAWSGFEVGGGQSLRLAQDAVTHLVAHEDRRGGGFADTCAIGRDAAEQWLARFPALVHPDTCDDAALELLVFTQEGNKLLYPGSHGAHSNVSFVYMDGRCSEYEDWTFAAVLWR
jgi:hypothetical protein